MKKEQLINIFSDGMIMDFHPLVTSNKILTNALNATLITNNGNERILLNDMGNGRVETAYLPEGYIPIGTSTYGGIIYIVSYNPLKNKCQIGCFPSPERNISKDETGEPNVGLDINEFQELDNDKNPTGKIKTTSIKKILTDNLLQAGDKYLITFDTDETKNLSDYGNSDLEHGLFPKLVKIHIVSIEDSGNITYLDSSTKWYNENNSYYYIKAALDNENGNTSNLDDYRSIVSSAYSVFSSKVSGKLALIIELETIKGFSCTWDVVLGDIYYEAIQNTTPEFPNIGDNENIEIVSDELVIENNCKPGTFNGLPFKPSDLSICINNLYKKDYTLRFHINWETDNNNINPSHIVLYDFKQLNGLTEKNIYPVTVVNYNNNNYLFSSKPVNLFKNEIYSFNNPNPEGGYYYKNITRGYQPEIDSDYSKFKEELEYESYKDSLLKDITLNSNDSGTLQKAPYKAYLESITNEGSQYVINCELINNGKYYTIDSDGELQECKLVSINDDLINNYFKLSVTKEFCNVSIPLYQEIHIGSDIKTINIDTSNLVYKYNVSPAMPYGILDHLGIEGIIDFSKIGKKEINLNTWKYYNTENICTLQWGLDAYVEENKGISNVTIEFYDNNGLAAAYHSNNKESYNGKFTDYIQFNNSSSNNKLNAIDNEGNVFYHIGQIVDKTNLVEGTTYITEDLTLVSTDDIKNDESDTKYYINNAGTLYSNIVYLARICVNYCTKNALGEYDTNNKETLYFYRWVWTNRMFNKHYNTYNDFEKLNFQLDLDLNAVYSQVNNGSLYNTVEYKGIENNDVVNIGDEYKQLKSTITYSNLEGNDNIKCQVLAGLIDDYNTFNINSASLDGFKIDMYLGKSYIECPQYPEYESDENIKKVFEGIYPVNINDTNLNTPGHSVIKYLNTNKEIYGSNFNELILNIKSELSSTSTETESIIELSFDGFIDNITTLNSTLEDDSNYVSLDAFKKYIKYHNELIDNIYADDEYKDYYKLQESDYKMVVSPLENILFYRIKDGNKFIISESFDYNDIKMTYYYEINTAENDNTIENHIYLNYYKTPSDSVLYYTYINKIKTYYKYNESDLQLFTPDNTKVESEGDINESNVSYENYKNDFSLIFSKHNTTKSISYLSENGETTFNCVHIKNKTLKDIELSTSNYIPLLFQGIFFSKYYNYVEEKEKEVNVLRPLLYTEEDAIKYNLVASGEHSNIKFAFKNIGFLAFGRDNNSSVFRFTTENNIESELNLTSFTTTLYRDNFNGNLPYYLYKSFLTVKGANLQMSELYKGITPIVLFNIEAGYGYGGNSDKIKSSSIKKYTQDDLLKSLKSGNHFFGSSTLDDLSILSYTKWDGRTSISDDKPSYTFPPDEITITNSEDPFIPVILTLKDSNDNLHFLNLVLLLTYNKDTKTLDLNKSEVANNLAKLLMNIYLKDLSTSLLKINILNNQVNLKDHQIIFKKDIIFDFKAESKDDTSSNGLIIMSNMDYNEYINSILKIFEGIDITTYNVNVLFNSIRKNCPILFQYNYIKPNDLITPYINTVVLQNGKPITVNSEFQSNVLYYKNNNLFNIVTDKFLYFDGNIINNEGVYCYTNNTEKVIRNLHLSKNFTLKNSELVCNNTSTESSNYTKRFCVVNNMKSSSSKTCNFKDIYEDEILLDNISIKPINE